MVKVIFEDSIEKKEDYVKLKRNLTETPLVKSVDLDNILEQLNLDIVNILKFNRI